MWLASFILLVLLARELQLAMWLARSTRIKVVRRGLWAVEVRRRVRMERLPDHVSAFPVPREERALVGRLAGLVLWRREVSVALPSSACERLNEVAPGDFDHKFPAWLRLATSPG